MGICASKQEISISEKEQIEFIYSLTNSFQSLESYAIKLNKEEDIKLKMKKYLFFLNSLNEIRPYLRHLQNGRHCDGEVKSTLEKIFNSIEEYDQERFFSLFKRFKEYFIEH